MSQNLPVYELLNPEFMVITAGVAPYRFAQYTVAAPVCCYLILSSFSTVVTSIAV